MRRQETLNCHDESGDRGLHVRGAASKELSIALGGNEGIGMPLVERTGGHDVRVADEAEKGTGRAASSPEIGHLAAPDRLDRESEPRKSCSQQFLAAAVFGSDRAARDQLAGKPQRRGRVNGRHGDLRWNRRSREQSGGSRRPASMLCALRLAGVELELAERSTASGSRGSCLRVSFLARRKIG